MVPYRPLTFNRSVHTCDIKILLIRQCKLERVCLFCALFSVPSSDNSLLDCKMVRFRLQLIGLWAESDQSSPKKVLSCSKWNQPEKGCFLGSLLWTSHDLMLSYLEWGKSPYFCLMSQSHSGVTSYQHLILF